MTNVRKEFIIVLGLLSLAFSCVATHPLTPMQKRQITTRIVNAPYEDTFRATLTVLQEEDYNINYTDMETGVIVADVERELSIVWKVVGALAHLFSFGADETETEERWDYLIDCLITEINNTSTEVRIIIQKVTHSKITYHKEERVEVKQEPETIYDQKIYQDFFNKIKVEIKKR